MALCQWKKNTIWAWRAYDPCAGRTLAWELGGRDDATARKLLDRVGFDTNTFVTDDWDGYHRLIPQERLFTGKDLTVPIERDNSRIRHCLARFRRRSKTTSRSEEMVSLSLKLLHNLQDTETFKALQKVALSIFG